MAPFPALIGLCGNTVTCVAATPKRLDQPQTKSNGLLQPGDVVSSSAAIVNGVVYVGTDSLGMFAFDASDSDVIWNNQDLQNVASSPAVVDGVVYVGSFSDNCVYALNAATGVQLWRS